MVKLDVTCPAFGHNATIPPKYTCDGDDINPQIDIAGVPHGAKSLALIMDDPDAPMGTWDHWVVFDIPVRGTINEDTVPGKEGLNSWNRNSWGGPCPPLGTHRYFFKVYALDTKLGLGADAKKGDVEKAMKGHILAKGELIGLYKRQ